MNTPTNNLKYKLVSATYGDRVVTPAGESSFNLKIELVDDEITDPIYDYVYTFDGTLIFVGADFNWIYEIENDPEHRGDDLFIEITKQDDSSIGVNVPVLKLILNTGTFNLDRCTLEIAVTPMDVYQNFNTAKNDELNIFDCTAAKVSVNLYDYVPTYEYNVTAAEIDGMDLTHQNFSHYPNKRAQYPGFACEGENADAYWPESATTLFVTDDLTTLETDPVTFEEYLSTGSIPYHSDYPTYSGAFDAVADGWRLYYFQYRITDAGGVMDMICRWKWVRETKDVTIGTVMPSDWVYVGVVAGMDRWARAAVLMPRANVYKSSFVTESFPDAHQIFIETSYFINGVDTGTDTAAPAFGTDSEVSGTDYYQVFGFSALTNGYRVNDILEMALAHCDPTLTIKSNFLQLNPFVISATNYVTGEPTFTDNLLIYQKSDIKRAWAPDKAVQGTFTTAEIIGWLNTMTKLRYRIDGTHFVLEHITAPYFRRAMTLDLTTDPYLKYLNGLRIYKYDTSIKLASKETYAFMEQRPQLSFEPTDDFAGAPILYNGNNVDRSSTSGVQAYSVGRVTTDIHYVLEHGGSIGYLIDSVTGNPYPVQDATDDSTISDDGFCIIASQIIGGNYHGVTLPGILDDVDRFNNAMGWAQLQNAFFRSERNAPTGSMNNAPVVFANTKYIRMSGPLAFNICDITDFDPFELINSAMGLGLLKSVRYAFYDSIMTVTLGYR